MTGLLTVPVELSLFESQKPGSWYYLHMIYHTLLVAYLVVTLLHTQDDDVTKLLRLPLEASGPGSSILFDVIDRTSLQVFAAFEKLTAAQSCHEPVEERSSHGDDDVKDKQSCPTPAAAAFAVPPQYSRYGLKPRGPWVRGRIISGIDSPEDTLSELGYKHVQVNQTGDEGASFGVLDTSTPMMPGIVNRWAATYPRDQQNGDDGRPIGRSYLVAATA